MMFLLKPRVRLNIRRKREFDDYMKFIRADCPLPDERAALITSSQDSRILIETKLRNMSLSFRLVVDILDWQQMSTVFSSVLC